MNTSPTVLIVEDELIMVMLLELRLKAEGFSLYESVGSSEDAIASALTNRPDFIIMDIRLSGSKDGITAAEEILEKIKTHIIFTTGYSNKETIQRANELKPTAFLIKPFEISDLISIMKKHR